MVPAEAPTPLRRLRIVGSAKRTQSPAVSANENKHANVTPGAAGEDGKREELTPALQNVQHRQGVGRRYLYQRCGFRVALATSIMLFVVAWLWTMFGDVPKPEGSEAYTFFKGEGKLVRPRLWLLDNLSCVGPRAAVLDVLVGAPYEFDLAGSAGEALYLARLAKAAAIKDSATTNQQLRELVKQLLHHGGGSPTLQRRLMDALSTPCEASERCSAQGAGTEFLPLEVDHAATTQPAKTETSWMHQFFLHAGAATGLTTLRDRADAYHSKPPEVVLRADSPPQMGSCFGWRMNATMAFRLVGEGKIVRHIVLEQIQRWASPRPHASPRRFSVYGDSGTKEYDRPLGHFEYQLAAPAVQAFQLDKAVTLHGLRIVFDGPGWSTEFPICLYRIRAYEGPPPSCTGGRLALKVS